MTGARGTRHAWRRGISAVVTALAIVVTAAPASADRSEKSGDAMRNLLKRAEEDYRLGTAEGLVERLRPAAGRLQPAAPRPAAEPAPQPAIATLPQRIPLERTNAPAPIAKPAPPDATSARVPPPPKPTPLRNAAITPAEILKQSPATSEARQILNPNVPVIPAREIEAGPRAPPEVVAAPPSPAKPAVADAPVAAQAEARRPTPAQCRDIIERAQIGAAGPGEIQLLRTHCR